jgi:transcriptional regulator with XRE-family HTH domain
MDARIIGQRVRELRLERNWSLRQLAARAEVSHQYIDFLEKGQRSRLDLSMLRKLAAGFGLPLAELIGDQPGGGDYEYAYAGGAESPGSMDDLQLNLLRIGTIHRELGPDSLKQLAGVIEAVKREAEREYMEGTRAKREPGGPGQAGPADREA